MVDEEVIDGESAPDSRTRGCGFDPVDVGSRGQFGAELASAVRGIGQHDYRRILALKQR
jgi:hypothetical protein